MTRVANEPAVDATGTKTTLERMLPESARHKSATSGLISNRYSERHLPGDWVCAFIS